MGVELRKGDLFKICEEPELSRFALAHCISEDCAMGKGIAVEFRDRFGGINELEEQVAAGKKTGFACVLHRQRPVYYLITKKFYYDFPTYESLRRSLEDMHKSMKTSNVEGVIMPRIGCGLDKLEWEKVFPIIEEVFKEGDSRVIVCSRSQ